MPTVITEQSDDELIADVRDGSSEAYHRLYDRHCTAARNLAWHLTQNAVEADDLVAEAFARVLAALRGNGGPNSAFRTYLLTTLRNIAYEQHRRDNRVNLCGDMTTHDKAEIPPDTVMVAAERSLVVKAFGQLPERWQAVLWHTEIEGTSVTEVATMLGLTPNGVSALAYRAREGLRQAYLQAHLAGADPSGCQAAVALLGAWTRGGLHKRETAQVEAHLDCCDRCRSLAAELTDLNTTLRAVVGPLVLGGAAAAYLTVTKANSVAVGAIAAKSSVMNWLQLVGVNAALATVVALGVSTMDLDPTTPIAMGEKPVPPNLIVVPPTTSTTTTVAPTIPPPSPAPATTTTTVLPPVPTRARLTAETNRDSIALSPDDGPAVVPVVITNSGQTVSGAITMTLTLPKAVRYNGPATTVGDAGTVDCAQTDATLTCHTREGLKGGRRGLIDVPLGYDQGAVAGTVSGSVTDGTSSATIKSVAVAVNPWSVRASASVAFNRIAQIALSVTNTGTAPAEAAIEIATPDGTFADSFDLLHCTPFGPVIRCRRTIDPGDTFNTWMFVKSLTGRAESAQVTLTSGQDVVRRSVPLDFR